MLSPEQCSINMHCIEGGKKLHFILASLQCIAQGSNYHGKRSDLSSYFLHCAGSWSSSRILGQAWLCRTRVTFSTGHPFNPGFVFSILGPNNTCTWTLFTKGHYATCYTPISIRQEQRCSWSYWPIIHQKYIVTMTRNTQKQWNKKNVGNEVNSTMSDALLFYFFLLY